LRVGHISIARRYSYCAGLDLKRGAVAQVAARREKFV